MPPATSKPGTPRRLATIERAFELARSGSCRSIEEIVKRLRQEQMDQVDAHLGGHSIRKELRQACAESRSRRENREPPADIAAE
jgi:hypothetical protein